MSSKVVSLRVSEDQVERLKRKARQLGTSPSETGARLLEESLRRDAFAFIDFHDSPLGRQAYVMGSRLAVWQVITVVRSFDGDAEATAAHLGWPTLKVRAAMTYADAHPDEIQFALSDADAIDATALIRLLPNLEEVAVAPRPALRRRRRGKA